jgi:hypothetical protein
VTCVVDKYLMKITDIINESLSKTVFHYTKAAHKILASGQFELSSAVGNIEEKYAPKGYPYFLSTTRTRHGGYHDFVPAYAALFVLDGNWFNNKYPSKPIDYWENRDPTKSHHRKHEAEDRVFSKEPTIPIDGVVAVHFLLKEDDASDPAKANTRLAMIAAKKRKIPAYFYTDVNAWKNFDTRHQGDISMLTGQMSLGRTSGYRGSLLPWIELVKAKSKNQLSKEADRLQYNLQYTYNKQDAVRGLSNEMHNARKPDSGVDRKRAIAIISFMQQNKLTTVEEFVNALAEKWKQLK